MITVAIIAVVFAVISAYYYLQIIKSMYFEDSDKEITVNAPMDMKLVLSINRNFVHFLAILGSAYLVVNFHCLLL
jgi:NADH-quinone oxidoreductase subunit N